MKKKQNLDTYRLLVELKNEGSIPEKHQRDADRCIRNLEESLEKNISINVEILGVIATIFKDWLSPP